MPWATSILVLQPRTSTETAGPLGRVVWIETGVSEARGGNVGTLVAVINERLVAVENWTVGVGLAPITTGVAVRIDGVFVGGRKGVGGLNGPGWSTQPLQDATKNIARMTGITFFISSPPGHCIPLYSGEHSPLLAQR